MRAERGQALVELVASVPVVLAAAVVCLQLLLHGYAASVADGAAHAAGLAVAGGRPAGPAARGALPGWARSRAQVRARGGRVLVVVRTPVLVPGIAGRLRVRAETQVEAGQ